MCFFFFKQKPAYGMRISDWSSDLCSSDLSGQAGSTSLSVREPAPADIDWIASLQALSQRRQDSAQMRQCSCLLAWRSHSSAQTRQASAHASRVATITCSLVPVRRVAIVPEATQISAQSRLRRMHCRSWSTISSATQASAHDVQLWAQE